VFRVDGALVIKLPLVFGKSYFYCGGCFTLHPKHVCDLAKKENAVFLKLEPMLALRSLGGAGVEESINAGFKKSAKEVQPQKTIVLDLSKSEEELLQDMHAKTRYNIRLAERKGLRFKVYDRGGASGVFDAFWQMLKETAKRDRFETHERVYYEKLLGYTKLFALMRQGKMVASAIVLLSDKKATYLHGASDYTQRNLMAPYLLHWEIVKYAKEQGCIEYDFWGIDAKKWPGLTRFKRGFGGRELEYIGSYDYIFQPFWYVAYNFYRKLKAILCG
jgi:lipid II:glycine glycyltransferase (peptidoglycan interpeptide bridge formation enzyme)